MVICTDPDIDENKFELLIASMTAFLNRSKSLKFHVELQKEYRPVTIIPPGEDPKVGDIIVVPPSDNHYGGKAEVSKVFKATSGGEQVTCVNLVELGPGLQYNWEEFISKDQLKLIESYGNQWARRG